MKIKSVKILKKSVKVYDIGVEDNHNFYVKPKGSESHILVHNCQGATPHTKKEILKHLEEPPPNVVWILCTMNPEKINDAIKGRCLVQYWRYPEVLPLAKRLLKIAKLEYKPKIVKALKPHLKTIVSNCNKQPRKSLQTLEMVASALIAAKPSSKSGVKKLVNEYVNSSTDLDTQVIRFITHTYLGKKLQPLNIIRNIDTARLEEFLIILHRYAFYSSIYFLHLKSKQPVDATGFYGINFIRFQQSLKKIQKRADETNAFKLCGAVTIALEKIRLGLVTNESAIMVAFNEYHN